MSVAGIIGALLLAGIGLVYLGLPFFKRRAAAPAYTGQQLELLAIYERIIGTVRDLDEDYQVGKIAHEQYAAERAEWLGRGTAALEALDKLGVDLTQLGATQEKLPNIQGQDDDIEAAVAAYIRAQRRTMGQAPAREHTGD